MKTRAPLLVLVLAGVAVTIAADSDGHWPQWRGPSASGYTENAHDLPIKWSETENLDKPERYQRENQRVSLT